MNNQVSSTSINFRSINGKALSGSKLDLPMQADLFDTLKQLRFNGQLLLTKPEGDRWSIYFYLGHVVFATGGCHPVKRWYRNLLAYLPEQAADLFAEQSELSRIETDGNRCWQYQLLHCWVKQGKITRQQATKIIWSTLVEILFDITQTGEVVYKLEPSQFSGQAIVVIDGTALIGEVKRKWLTWQAAKATNYPPNLAPVIRQPDQLQQNTSKTVFEMLNRLLNGQQTLRDIALEMKRETLSVACFLLPYLQSQLVELINIPDLPAPIIESSLELGIPSPLIACVDDSPLVCHTLEQFMTGSGYRFVGINNPLKAVGMLLSLKPDLIFLDLMMPHTNGYEICDKLRRISIFRNTPIIILTGNDGVIDRVKTKLVGASGFLSKVNVDTEAVRETLQKHLRHCTLSQLTSSQLPNRDQKAA